MMPEAMEALMIIWNSLYTADELSCCDAILAFGCADPMVASRAAELYLQGWAPRLVFSGGLGKGTQGRLAKSEAECYADIALSMGVPEEHMILETKSTNTGENLRFTYELIRHLKVRRAIVVHQPNMGKRTRFCRLLITSLLSTCRMKQCILSACAPADMWLRQHRKRAVLLPTK